MKEELITHASNHTWSIIHLPAGKHVMGCLWIFKTKFNSDGTIEWHKARLVALDYKEIFAPVAKKTTV